MSRVLDANTRAVVNNLRTNYCWHRFVHHLFLVKGFILMGLILLGLWQAQRTDDSIKIAQIQLQIIALATMVGVLGLGVLIHHLAVMIIIVNTQLNHQVGLAPVEAVALLSPV